MDLSQPFVVEIAIEHLSVEGFGGVDAALLQRSLQRDLARVITERGLPDTWTTGGSLGDLTTTLDWDGRGGSEALSQTLAVQLYEGMTS